MPRWSYLRWFIQVHMHHSYELVEIRAKFNYIELNLNQIELKMSWTKNELNLNRLNLKRTKGGWIFGFPLFDCLCMWLLYILYVFCGIIHGWYNIWNWIYDFGLKSWHFKCLSFQLLWIFLIYNSTNLVGYKQAIQMALSGTGSLRLVCNLII